MVRALLFVFVQRGLQQVEGVHQSRGEAALFPRSSPEPLRLGRAPGQVKLLLRLFADQLGLSGLRANTGQTFGLLLQKLRKRRPAAVAKRKK